VVVYYYPLEMCFADNNLGAKIDFSVFLKDIIKYLFAENIGIVFQAKDDAALESKNANNVAFTKWELLLPKRL
jgi:phosphoribosylformylglycinamidine synthase